MIPSLPNSVSDEDMVDFYSKLAGNLSDQSTVHINWHTHRRNPSVCWICDTHILLSVLLKEIERFISKSSLDMETVLESEKDSDAEIEVDYEYPDEVLN